MSYFLDRREAGARLARSLIQFAGRDDAIVLALPRGGVPVGYEVARALHLPLDVFVVRKLGMPGHPEYAIGAIASGGVRVVDDHAMHVGDVSAFELEQVTAAEQRELSRREELYRGSRPFPDLTGRTVILVDDGLATGSTMRAAVQALRMERPARIVVAVPVGAPDTCDAFRDVADDVVCAVTPERFYAVGAWYADFSETSDAEVHDLLEEARHETAVRR